MPFMYSADVFCDSCGQAIRDTIDAEGFAPADPDDESSYDSGEYPKRVEDDETADSPQHCGAHAECLEAVELPSGRKIGAPIGRLTCQGERYVREALEEGGEVAEYWAELYEVEL